MNSKEIHTVAPSNNESSLRLTQELHGIVQSNNDASEKHDSTESTNEIKLNNEYENIRNEIFARFNELIDANEYYYGLINDIKKPVERMLSSVMYESHSGDQIDRLAVQLADELSSKLTSEDSKGETGTVGVDKQLKSEAEKLSSFNMDGSGLYEASQYVIKNYLNGYENISKGSLNSEQLKITLNALEHKLSETYRSAHGLQSEIDGLLEYATRITEDKLSDLKRLANGVEGGQLDRQGPALSLKVGAENILSYLASLRSESRKYALQCQDKLTMLHERVGALDKEL
ncbi:MAG: hypothetical protein WCH00_01700 [Candidatus Saccharibacteria bacterium]